ncbi:hypothetical protein SeMB42_g01693 [Synchytrium endobioticum]|uniref:Decapping nuclease n=1 Tax=Synchytrium endobioticum TaxID=286115 RepID=A0A507DKS7_9FUNG|nr:hypothetical protein SeLEV6574_g03761 [Synchytrium endobioticum]TPX52031.1 hypothetical protein SeMB42_g01693 [Synchytrium endobioticum]
MKRAASLPATTGVQSSPRKRARRSALDELPRPTRKDEIIASLPTTRSVYVGKSVPFQQPTEIACFTYDHQRKVHANSSAGLNQYRPLDLRSRTYDLNEGFPDRFVERDASVAEHLDALLETLNPSHLSSPPAICTWRGIMTKLCSSLYSNDSYTFAATRHKNTIYITELVTPTSKGGGKLGVVNTNEQYCSIFKTKLGDTSLLLGGEVDCMMAKEKPLSAPQSVYAELKTSRAITDARKRTSFYKFKLIKMWLQSYLAGVPLIQCAFRDDQGIVKSVETYQVERIPRMAKDVLKKDSWDANACLVFGDAICQLLKKVISHDDVFGIRFDGEGEIVIWRLGQVYQFLPEAFLATATS